MSSAVSWPTSRAISSFKEDSDIEDPEANFDQPEYFHRVSGKRGWYCRVCAPSEGSHLLTFTTAAAMIHEKSQDHKDTVAHVTPWEPTHTQNWGLNLNSWGVSLNDWGVNLNSWGVNHLTTWGVEVTDWGVDVEEHKWGLALDRGPVHDPFDRLRESSLSRAVPTKKKIRKWIRNTARARGMEYEDDEDLDNDDTDLTDWTQWGAGGDDWKRPVEEWGFPPGGLPPVDEEPDPQATADFQFVEKVAKKRGLTKHRRRLHAFYRLPTDEKISRIQEIVRFIHTH